MPTSTQAPWISDYDMYLLEEGTHCRAYEKMGAHLGELAGQSGVHFAVWAPNAKQVSVLGDFNGWNRDRMPSYRAEQLGYGRALYRMWGRGPETCPNPA